ncbi:anti-virulence regulator CigR family protein [Pseudomonas sp. Pseusp97]|uniref:anti-virulence regulator CigR family protein n=1 Tax=Pseudomonas sp. Pseusp97 TaxID=3243065 RepID=UPI0039A445C4
MSRPNPLLAAALGLALVSASPLLLADPGKNKGHDKGGQHGNQGSGPSIDIGGVQVILNDNRNYWNPGTALSPGIQKNLARGKPLPPGIAKKLDGRLVGRLPHYDGYEWQQAGTDLLLVTIATGVIYEVLHNVLD